MRVLDLSGDLAYVDVALLPGFYALTTYELVIVYLNHLPQLFVKFFGTKRVWRDV